MNCGLCQYWVDQKWSVWYDTTGFKDNIYMMECMDCKQVRVFEQWKNNRIYLIELLLNKSNVEYLIWRLK